MIKKQRPTIIVDKNLIIRSLDREYLDDVLEIEEMSFTLPWSRDSYYHELGGNPLSRFFGLFWQDRLIAFGGFWLIMDEAHVANVAVQPLFRGQGLGELLMRKLMTYALSEGALKMTLEVRETNYTAQNLYEKLGFVSSGARPGYYHDTGEAALILWCNLKEENES